MRSSAGRQLKCTVVLRATATLPHKLPPLNCWVTALLLHCQHSEMQNGVWYPPPHLVCCIRSSWSNPSITSCVFDVRVCQYLNDRSTLTWAAFKLVASRTALATYLNSTLQLCCSALLVTSIPSTKPVLGFYLALFLMILANIAASTDLVTPAM